MKKVDIALDNTGVPCYLCDGEWHGFTAAHHWESRAKRVARGYFLSFEEDEMIRLGLDTAKIIHTYMVDE